VIRVAAVVQRYGREIVGGSETLARDVAERLSASGFDVTVFTTTAKDYVTWQNHFRPGESVLRGVTIRRFPVDRPRDIESFNRFSTEFFAEDPALRHEAKWIFEQGPFCPDLTAAIAREQDDFDVFLFFTYLYFPTVEGIPLIHRPVILFPTAHDEPPLYLAAMRPVFSRPATLMFLTRAEQDLVARRFSPPGRSMLVRTGLDLTPAPDETAFRQRHSIYFPYLLYAGRIERGKGLEAVFEHFATVRSRRLVELILIGKKLMDLPAQEGVRYLGYVSEEEKRAAFRGALCSVQPSPLESLSITTLESFAQETPVLVNRECAALMEHVTLSHGGLAYSGGEEFVTAVDTFLHKRRERRAMGKGGLAYVRDHYSWPAVMATIGDEVRRLAEGGAPS